MVDAMSSFVFYLATTHPFITGVAVLAVCWLVVKYITSGRKRRVTDYAKKFDPVDVSTLDTGKNNLTTCAMGACLRWPRVKCVSGLSKGNIQQGGPTKHCTGPNNIRGRN